MPDDEDWTRCRRCGQLYRLEPHVCPKHPAIAERDAARAVLAAERAAREAAEAEVARLRAVAVAARAYRRVWDADDVVAVGYARGALFAAAEALAPAEAAREGE